MGAVAGHPLDHPVAFGDLVFHDGVKIGEDTHSQGEPVAEGGQAGRGRPAGDVMDAVGGDEFIGDSEVALVENFLDHAAGAGLQVVRGHGVAPRGSRRQA